MLLVDSWLYAKSAPQLSTFVNSRGFPLTPLHTANSSANKIANGNLPIRVLTLYVCWISDYASAGTLEYRFYHTAVLGFDVKETSEYADRMCLPSLKGRVRTP
jgi:hypothetical protein